jgi:hypothetical protein
MSSKVSRLAALFVAGSGLVLAIPACGTKIAECNKFVEEANKGQDAFSKLDMHKEDSLQSTLTEVDASNSRLAEMKFQDGKLSELQAGYVKALKAVTEKMGKVDEILKAVQDAKNKGDETALTAKKAEFEALTPEVDKAVKDSRTSIDDLNTYCTGSK